MREKPSRSNKAFDPRFAAGHVTHRAFSILYEDNHLLVVSKPAMLPTMGVSQGQLSLVTLAKDYLKRKYDKPGNVYLGVVSRLDSPVTGALVLARTSKAARRLTTQFRQATVEKRYWAMVPGSIVPAEDHCVDWIRKNEGRRRMQVAKAHGVGASEARMSYRLLRHLHRRCLLEIRLETGRKHQIRVQLAHRGYPILGDRKYGSEQVFPFGIALHARQLILEHPVRKTMLRLTAPVPETWSRFGVTGD